MGKSFSELDLISTHSFTCAKKYTLIDVGAHQGSSSEPFALRGWKVVAFEPEQYNRSVFLKSLGRLPNVTCIPKAVSNVSGTKVPFYVSKVHYGIHSLMPFHDTHELSGEVETVRLDSVLEQLAVEEVTILKIDIEGADFLALQSFDFIKFKPQLVMVEFMDDRSFANYGYTHHDMVRFMADHGFTVFISEWAPIKEYGREDVEGEPHTWLQCVHYPLDHEPAWGNLIFVPESHRENFSVTLDHYLTFLSEPAPSGWRRLFKMVLG